MHVNVRYNKIVIITQLCVAYNKNVILSHVTVLSVFEDLDQKFFFEPIRWEQGPSYCLTWLSLANKSKSWLAGFYVSMHVEIVNLK